MNREYENYDDPILEHYSSDGMPLWMATLELIILIMIPVVLIANVWLNRAELTIIALVLCMSIPVFAMHAGNKGWI